MAALTLSAPPGNIVGNGFSIQGVLPSDLPGAKRLRLTIAASTNKKCGEIVLRSTLRLHGELEPRVREHMLVLPMPAKDDESGVFHYSASYYYDTNGQEPVLLDLMLQRLVEHHCDTFKGEIRVHHLTADVGPSDKTPLLDLTERVWQAD